jgi:pimeloyl-ACP methyl ester carboxylesterase
MLSLGVPVIPPEELGRIDVPTTLIWGRYDRANRLQISPTLPVQSKICIPTARSSVKARR